MKGLRPQHTIGIPFRDIAGDGVYTHDLAVNPLSVVLLNLRPLNDTGTLANFCDVMEIAQAINDVQILFRGETIKRFSGADLVAYNWFRWGILPWEANPVTTNNEIRCVTIPIIMGKNPYDPKSCFPATRRGELQLSLDLDDADTGYDTLGYSVDFIELLEAKPAEFEKSVTQSITFAATGDNDVDFPLGNVFRNVLAFGTTGYAVANAATLKRLKVLLGNVEAHYTAVDFEVANVLAMLWGRQGAFFRHQHRTTTDGNVQTSVSTLGRPELIQDGLSKYAWLDFDPTKDDTYSLDTAGENRFHVRVTAGTADAARFIPTEVVKTAGLV